MTTQTPQEIAQQLADTIFPPHPVEKAHKESDGTYTYRTETLSKFPDSTPTVVYIAEDGHPSIRTLTYLEVVEALLQTHEITPK